jgi:hypothetical protein
MFASVVDGRFALVSADIPQLTGRAQQRFAQFVAQLRHLRTFAKRHSPEL